MGWYRSFIIWLGRVGWAGRLSPAIRRIDQFLYPRTRGRVLATGPQVFPTLLLTTRGKKTGQSRTVALLYLEEEDHLVVVGSNWGRRDHPDWSANLLVFPQARVQVDAQSFGVRATLASQFQAERVWPRLLELWPPWTEYSRRAHRRFRIFFLSRQ